MKEQQSSVPKSPAHKISRPIVNNQINVVEMLVTTREARRDRKAKVDPISPTTGQVQL
jgi:hypothetical protein